MKQDVKESRKNLRWYMRYLHNKIGFFISGLVIIYALSGLVQTYRDTNFLKHAVVQEKQLPASLTEAQLGSNLKMRDFKIIKSTPDSLYFKDGAYSPASGKAVYSTMEWYGWIKPFTELHKTASKSVAHYFTTIFGFAMLFMSISAFWMFKPGTRLFSSGVWLTVAGIVAAVILLLM
jgi:hypothetical protein